MIWIDCEELPKIKVVHYWLWINETDLDSLLLGRPLQSENPHMKRAFFILILICFGVGSSQWFIGLYYLNWFKASHCGFVERFDRFLSTSP